MKRTYINATLEAACAAAKKMEPGESRRPFGELCTVFTGGDAPVSLYQTRTSYTVVYGLEVYSECTYAQAAEKFGCAVMHSLACAGLLDNERG